MKSKETLQAEQDDASELFGDGDLQSHILRPDAKVILE